MTDSALDRPPGAFVLLGDGLTEDGPWESGFPDRRTVNAGRAGDTTADVADRVQDVVAMDPATVVLTVGTNDFDHRTTVEQVVRGIEDVLFRLHHDLPDARLVVCSVLPRERERAEWIRQVNIHVRQFASTVKADFVDLWPELAEEDGELKPAYTEDRVHPNADGYAAWLEQLRGVVG